MSRCLTSAMVAALAFVCLSACVNGCRAGDEASSERAAGIEFFGELPSFALRDQTDSVYGSADMRGHVTIVNFIFTRCPTICPLFTLKFQGIQTKLGEAAVNYVSISVDPVHDTPAVLARYAEEHGARPERWKFLTGDPELIQRTAEQGLKLALERRGELEDGTPDIVHAGHFVLIDANGKIRGYYDSNVKARREALVLDAKSLAL